jgi:HEPN domain-containing protein
MALPLDIDARHFYRCAIERYDDALVLRKAGRLVGATYLAGYSVECMLKALLHTTVSPAKKHEVDKWFRGSDGHNLEGLRSLYLVNSRSKIDPIIGHCFIRVNSWSTNLRYRPGSHKMDVADRFLEDVRMILDWAKGRC